MKTSEVDHILRFFIRNFSVNCESSFEDLFESIESKPKVFKQAYRKFQCEYQFYVNRYMALSYIYNSLVNIGSLYTSMVFLHQNKLFNIDGGANELKFFMSVNEPFGHQVIMQYAKLYEALIDIDALNIESEFFNERDKKHARKMLDNKVLKDKYDYLGRLRKRIESSGVLYLRNSIFAHPFKDGGSGSVVFLKDVNDLMFTIFRELCDSKDRANYDSAQNRIKFFCDNYLMKATYDVKSVFKRELNMRTQAQKHIKELYEFMSVLRKEKLLDEEPLLMVAPSEAKDELGKLLKELKLPPHSLL